MNTFARSSVNAAVLAGFAAVCVAQQPQFKRTELQRSDLSAAGGGVREVVQVIAEIPPGVTAGRHTHPGEEISYVLEGTVLIEMDGKPAMTLSAGQVFIIPAGRIHNATNKTKANTKVLATYVIEKGKPLSTPTQ